MSWTCMYAIYRFKREKKKTNNGIYIYNVLNRVCLYTNMQQTKNKNIQ